MSVRENFAVIADSIHENLHNKHGKFISRESASVIAGVFVKNLRVNTMTAHKNLCVMKTLQ
ncbi:MAG: hypothetical protein IJS99_01575 [Synergistaceae bacterium]|nr:hypothetical protein [Synergistaceae bacterium]